MASNDDDDKKALEDILGDNAPQQPWSERTGTEPTSHKEEAAPAVAPAVGEAAAATQQTNPQWQAKIFQGFTPAQAMEGFDWNREQNTGKSAKDAFAYLSNEAAHAGHAAPLADKAALQAWANEYIVPGMNALGHNISDVQGDKFHLKNWQGDFDVDYGRGAGADGGALAWQVQEPTAKLSNAAYQPRAVPSLGGLAGLGDGVTGSTQPTAQEQLQKEIEALIAGGASPLDQQALLAQLQV